MEHKTGKRPHRLIEKHEGQAKKPHDTKKETGKAARERRAEENHSIVFASGGSSSTSPSSRISSDDSG